MPLGHWWTKRDGAPVTAAPEAPAHRDSARLAMALLDALGEGVVAVDRQQQLVHVNAAARQLLALHEPLPMARERLPDIPALHVALDAALHGMTTEAQEITVGDRAFSITAHPLADGGAVLVVSELTPLRHLETVRRDFVANVSHELRTPLTIIGGFAETLAQAHDDADVSAVERRRFASIILSNTRRMQRIVDELLDLSRIESGGWVPKPAPVDVREIAVESIAASQATANAGVLLTTEIEMAARTVYADRTALRQVVGNLVENAVRHTASGSVTVFAAPEPGGVRVGVRDTGVGIAPEHLPRIFERFYRVDTGRARDAGGTGLGLAIVKHLVEAHGGSVRAESTIGTGTTISAFFPAPPAPPRS